MTYEKSGKHIRIALQRDFNLLTARKVEWLCQDVDEVVIDLSRSKIVNSEAVIVLYRLIRAKKKVTLHHAPPIFQEVIRILGLEEIFHPEELVISH